jgi:hypothetical protein
MLVWSVTAVAGFDSAWTAISGRSLHAQGRACALLPAPRWVSYELETAAEFATSRMAVEVRTDHGASALELRRASNRWTVNGQPRPDLDGALDCDLEGCPLTNTMPILRHDLHRRSGDRTFLMAFIELPTLRVVASEQRYTHLGREPRGARVRYSSGSFESDLLVDDDGFVIEYPKLGRRLE